MPLGEVEALAIEVELIHAGELGVAAADADRRHRYPARDDRVTQLASVELYVGARDRAYHDTDVDAERQSLVHPQRRHGRVGYVRAGFREDSAVLELRVGHRDSHIETGNAEWRGGRQRLVRQRRAQVLGKRMEFVLIGEKQDIYVL